MGAVERAQQVVALACAACAVMLFLVPLLAPALTPQLSGRRGVARQVASWCAVGLVAGLCVATKLNGGAVLFARLTETTTWAREMAQSEPIKNSKQQ